MQGWIRNLNPARCFALALALGAGSSAVAATGHAELDLGIARFALATGNEAAALRYTREPSSENESLIRAKALLNTGNQQAAVPLLDSLIDGDYHRGEAALLRSGMIRDDRSARVRLLEKASKIGHGDVRQQAVQRVRDLDNMLLQMEQQKQTLGVFGDVLDDRLSGGSPGANGVSSELEDRFDALVRRAAEARDNAPEGTRQAEEIRQLTLTLSDLRHSADRFSARADRRDQTLEELSSAIQQALGALDRNRQRASTALNKANAVLDQRVLTYVDGEAERMVVALEKAEQQIAHLYEYLALQSLEREAQ